MQNRFWAFVVSLNIFFCQRTLLFQKIASLSIVSRVVILRKCAQLSFYLYAQPALIYILSYFILSFYPYKLFCI